MQINQIWAVYFSPTGSTGKLARFLARILGESLGLPVNELDYTLPAARAALHTFQKTDFVVWATPVYAGRVPNKLLPYMQGHLSATDTLALPVAVFGNRSFDDALAELCNILTSNRFIPLGAAALVARHPFSAVLGAGRPDEADLQKICAFAHGVVQKISLLTDIPPSVAVPGNNRPQAYYTPKGADGCPAHFLKAVPKTDVQRCTLCGVCSHHCPMGSISPSDPTHITNTCIKCHACVTHCPVGAKYFDDAALLSHKLMLEHSFSRRAEPAFFL